ncbi:MAG: carboxylating nicotinate-nucleotide diphosphorylase [Fimbriimonadaceae bacterium]|nr:carboxylating nicotinate-nucleotide diphosphorylase [Fimbriimonadaceae bacterium]
MSFPWLAPAPSGWESLIQAELDSDIGYGDFSSAVLEDKPVRWMIESQANGVVCGVGVAAWLLGPCEALIADGSTVSLGTRILEGKSSAPWLLSRERTALNALMLLSGTSTLTRQFVDAVEGTKAKITDTRKTIPGLRALQKYAVRCGGGTNHRFGLSDAVMIKDNHIAACGGVSECVNRVREMVGHTMVIEVEADTLLQAETAVEAGADIVLLDNMDTEQLSEAVSRLSGKAILEASGGVNLGTVRAIADTGVDVISIGALTHSAPSLSLHLELL